VHDDLNPEFGHPPCDIWPWLSGTFSAHLGSIKTMQGAAMTNARGAETSSQRIDAESRGDRARLDANPVVTSAVDGHR